MRKLSLLGLLLIIVGQLAAQRVSESQATQVCQRFLMDKHRSTGTENIKLADVYTQTNGDAALYRFQLPDVGFVIVSASMTTPPVLAYSFKNSFELIPPVEGLFDLYKKEIAYAEKERWDAKPKAAAAWARYLAEDFSPQKDASNEVGPLLTTLWNQNKFYNTYCPWDAASGSYYDYRVPNGCVALACAQILNYYRYPEHGYGSSTYVPQGYPRQTVNFGQSHYNYDAMCNVPTSYANEIAKLAYHFGVAIQMAYGVDGSGANSDKAKEKLVNTFKYDQNIASYYRSLYLDTMVTEYIQILKNEFDHRRVVYYSGCSEDFSNCHAYVLDGYDDEDRFSINYGWGGSSNGFYAIDNFVAGPMHLDYGAEALINIIPSAAVEDTYCQGHQRNTASFGYVADGSPTVKPYQSNPDCSWMVAVPSASAYEFTFDRLDLNEGDYVTIYNGPTVESGVRASFTGSEIPTGTYEVYADSVLITFVGNTNNTEHYGFLISYTSALPPRTCQTVTNMPNVWNAVLSDGSQEGEKYLPQTNCTWNLSHNFISGYAFAFPKFNLGYGDFVDVYNNTTNPPTLYKRFDIYDQPEGVYNVPFKRMRVNFVSDNWDQNEGFSLEYYAIDAVEDYNGIEDLTVYPNPATDYVNVEFSIPQSEKVTFQLLDLTGKMLKQSSLDGVVGANQYRFGIQGVAKGMYLLEVVTASGKTVRKITVQ